jgi:hypothetical protein
MTVQSVRKWYRVFENGQMNIHDDDDDDDMTTVLVCLALQGHM